MVISNMVMKFQNVYIFENFVTFLTCRLLTPAAWKVLTFSTRQVSADDQILNIFLKIQKKLFVNLDS